MSTHKPPTRILLIDDDAAFITVLSTRMEDWGYQVFKAHNGEDGLKAAEAHRPDLILLDTIMPKMKGREVCARLKQHPKLQHIPVIFLSGLSMAEHIKGGLDLGADDYIVKPFDTEELRDRIELALLRRNNDASGSD